MKTEFMQFEFALQGPKSRRSEFQRRWIAPLSRDRKAKDFIRAYANCCADHRNTERITFSIEELPKQRIFGMAITSKRIDERLSADKMGANGEEFPMAIQIHEPNEKIRLACLDESSID
jgi:hypothetical protein